MEIFGHDPHAVETVEENVEFRICRCHVVFRVPVSRNGLTKEIKTLIKINYLQKLTLPLTSGGEIKFSEHISELSCSNLCH